MAVDKYDHDLGGWVMGAEETDMTPKEYADIKLKIIECLRGSGIAGLNNIIEAAEQIFEWVTRQPCNPHGDQQ